MWVRNGDDAYCCGHASKRNNNDITLSLVTYFLIIKKIKKELHIFIAIYCVKTIRELVFTKSAFVCLFVLFALTDISHLRCIGGGDDAKPRGQNM